MSVLVRICAVCAARIGLCVVCAALAWFGPPDVSRAALFVEGLVLIWSAWALRRAAVKYRNARAVREEWEA